MTSRNRRFYLCRKARETDRGLLRAQEAVAVLLCTLEVQHPEHVAWLRDFVQDLDTMRVKLFWWQRFILGGTTRGLWVPGSLEMILAQAKPVEIPDCARRRGQVGRVDDIPT